LQVRSWLLKQLATQLKPQLLATVLQADRQLAALRTSSQTTTLTAAAATPLPAAAAAALVQQNASRATGRKLLQAAVSGVMPGSLVAAAGGAPVAAAVQQYAGPGAADGFSPPAVKARAARAAALGMLNYLQDPRLQQQMEARCVISDTPQRW
jgi:hypothetical protein